MLESLDHVILAVRDLEAATRQYALLLGRSVSWRGKHPGQGTANALFRVDNTYLELLAQEGHGAVGDAVRAFLEARGEAPVGLAFGTRDAEACRAWLAERGLTPAPLEKGIGRDVESGAFREWRRVPIPLTETRGVLLFAIEHTTPDGILPTAGLACDETAVVSALDHAVIRTPDPAAPRPRSRLPGVGHATAVLSGGRRHAGDRGAGSPPRGGVAGHGSGRGRQ
jgi:catechol 2,3-dioxygenase-like lactoylglutathione lyase family enzyme